MLMKLDKVTCVKYQSSVEMGECSEIVGHAVIALILTVVSLTACHSLNDFLLGIISLIGGHLQ